MLGLGNTFGRFFCLLCTLFFEEFCKLYERSLVNVKKFEQLNVVTYSGIYSKALILGDGKLF